MALLKTILCLSVICLVSCTSEPWYIRTMHISDIPVNGSSQRVAILDTGCNDYSGLSYNCIDDSEDVHDGHGHGTQMYQLLKEVSNDISTCVIKIADDEGETSYDYLLKGLSKAREFKASVVNISLGGYQSDSRVMKCIKEMLEEDISIVCASGDYGEYDLLFPSNIEGVISVGSINKDNQLTDYTNHNEQLVCTFPGDELTEIQNNGTSQSSILCSGYVGLLRDYYEKNHILYHSQDIVDKLSQLNVLKGKEMDYKQFFE